MVAKTTRLATQLPAVSSSSSSGPAVTTGSSPPTPGYVHHHGQLLSTTPRHHPPPLSTSRRQNDKTGSTTPTSVANLTTDKMLPDTPPTNEYNVHSTVDWYIIDESVAAVRRAAEVAQLGRHVGLAIGTTACSIAIFVLVVVLAVLYRQRVLNAPSYHPGPTRRQVLNASSRRSSSGSLKYSQAATADNPGLLTPGFTPGFTPGPGGLEGLYQPPAVPRSLVVATGSPCCHHDQQLLATSLGDDAFVTSSLTSASRFKNKNNNGNVREWFV